MEAYWHWMELTSQLPLDQWYVKGDNTASENLVYPPLTAYHMMVNGLIASYINPDWMSQNVSREKLDPSRPYFMRISVLTCDLLLFLPAAAVYFIRTNAADDEYSILCLVLVLVTYPGLALISNGHFLYDNVGRGLLILTTLAINEGHHVMATILFCLAASHNQLVLYHALPICAYFLGICIWEQALQGTKNLVKLTATILATHVVVLIGFLDTQGTITTIFQSIFSLKKDFCEYEVANFWCLISYLVNTSIFSVEKKAIISFSTTIVLLLPSLLYVLRNPTVKNLHLSMINASLVIFMFFYHVERESILLVAIAACFVLKDDKLVVCWLLLVSVFSLLPLLIEGGFLIPTAATVIFFWITITFLLSPKDNLENQFLDVFDWSMVLTVCLTVAVSLIPCPDCCPNLFSWLIAFVSFIHFMYFTVYFHVRLFQAEDYIAQMTTLFCDGNK